MMSLGDIVYEGAKSLVRRHIYRYYSTDLKVLGKENIPQEGSLIYSVTHLYKMQGSFLAGLAIDERVHYWADSPFFSVREAIPYFHHHHEEENPGQFSNYFKSLGLGLLTPSLFNILEFVPVPRYVDKDNTEGLRKMYKKTNEILSRGDRLMILSDASNTVFERDNYGCKEFNQGTIIAARKYLRSTGADSLPIQIVVSHKDNYSTLFGQPCYVKKEYILNTKSKQVKKQGTAILQQGRDNLMEILWSSLSDEEKVRQSKQIWDFLK